MCIVLLLHFMNFAKEKITRLYWNSIDFLVAKMTAEQLSTASTITVVETRLNPTRKRNQGTTLSELERTKRIEAETKLVFTPEILSTTRFSICNGSTRNDKHGITKELKNYNKKWIQNTSHLFGSLPGIWDEKITRATVHKKNQDYLGRLPAVSRLPYGQRSNPHIPIIPIFPVTITSHKNTNRLGNGEEDAITITGNELTLLVIWQLQRWKRARLFFTKRELKK